MTQPSSLAPDVDAMKEKLTAYLNAKVSVSAYVEAMLNTDISGIDFKSLPPDLKEKVPVNPETLITELQGELTTAKTHGMYWRNTVEPGLTAAPQAIINFSTQFKSDAGLIQSYLAKWIAAPTDETNYDVIKGLYSSIDQKIGEQQTAVQGEINDIKQFNTDITGDASNFSSKNQSFAELQEWDKDEMANLKSAIKGIEDVIKTLNKEITATGISTGASVAVVGIGARLESTGRPIAGTIVMVIGVIGLGISLGFLISALEKKAEEESKLTTDKLDLKEVTIQLHAVNTVESSLGEIVTKSETAETATQTILDTFTSLKVKVEAVVSDLDDSWNDVQKAKTTAEQTKIITDLASGLGDLTTAVTQWDELQTFATEMQGLSITKPEDPVQTTTLEVGSIKKAA